MLLYQDCFIQANQIPSFPTGPTVPVVVHVYYKYKLPWRIRQEFHITCQKGPEARQNKGVGCAVGYGEYLGHLKLTTLATVYGREEYMEVGGGQSVPYSQ